MIEYIIKIKKKTRSIFQDAWVWKMAWRDGRHNFSRLFLFIASLITGIAALVAIGSLNYSMQEELNKNAKELLQGIMDDIIKTIVDGDRLNFWKIRGFKYDQQYFKMAAQWIKRKEVSVPEEINIDFLPNQVLCQISRNGKSYVHSSSIFQIDSNDIPAIIKGWEKVEKNGVYLSKNNLNICGSIVDFRYSRAVTCSLSFDIKNNREKSIHISIFRNEKLYKKIEIVKSEQKKLIWIPILKDKFKIEIKLDERFLQKEHSMIESESILLRSIRFFPSP